MKPATLLKVTLLYGCFLRFLNCANCVKLCQIVQRITSHSASLCWKIFQLIIVEPCLNKTGFVSSFHKNCCYVVLKTFDRILIQLLTQLYHLSCYVFAKQIKFISIRWFFCSTDDRTNKVWFFSSFLTSVTHKYPLLQRNRFQNFYFLFLNQNCQIH